MNKVILRGHLGADGELRVSQSGVTSLRFNVATSKKWKDKESGDSKEQTEWHRCVMFDKRAEGLAQYLLKGTNVLVEGELKTSSYEKDGEKRFSTDIIVREVELLGGKKAADPWDGPGV